MLNWLLSAIAIGLLSVILTMPAHSRPKAEFREGEPLVLGSQAGRDINVRGYARGSVALFKTIGDRDVNQRRCMGYGSIAPDHVIELQEKTPRLTFRVSSREQDTTLIIEGPKGELYCADDTPEGNNKDAQLVLNNARNGNYRVWIGSFESGTGFRYSLNIRAQ
jgi:hypothetical protein